MRQLTFKSKAADTLRLRDNLLVRKLSKKRRSTASGPSK